MTYSRVKNILFYLFLCSYIIFCFLFYYNTSMIGDRWILQWDIKSIYSLQPGYHPGRNFGEYVSIFPRIFGGKLLTFIPDPMDRVKFATAFIDTLLMLSLWLISAVYATRTHRKLAIVFFALLSMHSIVPGLDYTVINSIGLLGLSYIAWSPMMFYLRDNRLPEWMIKSPYKFMGIWLVIIYCGTQVYDYTYFMIAPMSVLFFLYGILQKRNHKTVRPIDDAPSFYTVNLVNLSFLGLSAFAFFRNAVISRGGRASVYRPSYDIMELVQRFKANPFFFEVAVILGIILIIFYGISFYRSKKIEGRDFFTLSLCFGSISAISLVTFINASNSYTAWSLCIALGVIIFRLWDTQKVMQILLPTFLLFLFTELYVSRYHTYLKDLETPSVGETVKNKPVVLGDRVDAKIIELFKNAQRDGLKEIVLSEYDAAGYGIGGKDDYTLGARSYFMFFLGYTDNIIPIIITNDAKPAAP